MVEEEVKDVVVKHCEILSKVFSLQHMLHKVSLDLAILDNLLSVFQHLVVQVRVLVEVVDQVEGVQSLLVQVQGEVVNVQEDLQGRFIDIDNSFFHLRNFSLKTQILND